MFGGGTDIKEYYSRHGSTIMSFAIDKAVYLIHSNRPTGNYRVSYSRTEELHDLSSVRHTLVKETVRRFGTLPPCTLTMIGDVPKGTGLGSSSALSVALCSLMLGEVDGYSLLRYAYNLELGINPSVGIQDFLPAIFGGFNIYSIDTQGDVDIKHVPRRIWDIINTHGLLLYTGIDRKAAEVLKSLRGPIATTYLSRIHSLASLVMGNIDEVTVNSLAQALNLTWEFKRNIKDVSSDKLDNQYHAARTAGALGGKLCGAGAGGCWFFIVLPDRRAAVKRALGLTEIPFCVSEAGIKDWKLT